MWNELSKIDLRTRLALYKPWDPELGQPWKKRILVKNELQSRIHQTWQKRFQSLVLRILLAIRKEDLPDEEVVA
jgi:hypothetical protein